MLEWIEEYGGGVFFDIGANIGIYSLFYAKKYKQNVYSFEPSVFNLRQLAKNININKLSSNIFIIPNPLSDECKMASFLNGSSDEGGALSAFGVNYGYDGKPLDGKIQYNLLGFSIDYLFGSNILTEFPSLIKIDVDGIEHLILRGAKNVLSNETLRSVFIEVTDEFEEQSSEVFRILVNAGFKLKEKRRSELIGQLTTDGSFKGTFNQIWVRS